MRYRRARRACVKLRTRSGSFVEAGKRLGLDRRTVKEHVEKGSAGVGGPG